MTTERRTPGTYRTEGGGIEVIVDVPESASWVEDQFPDEVAFFRSAAFAAGRAAALGEGRDRLPVRLPCRCGRLWSEHDVHYPSATTVEEETAELRQAAHAVIDTFPVGRGDHLAALDALRVALAHPAEAEKGAGTCEHPPVEEWDE